jgi:hypothetical protein
LRWPKVKTLSQKHFKIDILLSHVKLNKMRIVTRPSKQKTTKTKCKMAAWKAIPTRIGKTKRPIFFKTDRRSVFGLLKNDIGFGLCFGFPLGSTIYINPGSKGGVKVGSSK